MLTTWEKQFPGRLETIFRSLSYVVPSHMLDPELYPFAGLKADGIDRSGERKGSYSPGISTRGEPKWKNLVMLPLARA